MIATLFTAARLCGALMSARCDVCDVRVGAMVCVGRMLS